MHFKHILPQYKDHGFSGEKNWRVVIIDIVAKMVGLQVKIEGIPFGTTRNVYLPSTHPEMFDSCDNDASCASPSDV